MISITNPAECCGCTACANICNHEAISMMPDALGFLYPVVDNNKCTHCGLCETVCSFNEYYDTSLNLEAPLAFGARQKDINEVMKSRSGAVFAALSDYVLDNDGVVYGAGYTDHFRVKHKRATTKDERDEFRGSKYVQSDLNVVFRQVKQDLKENRLVLFSGTACQISGLRSYIGNKLRENLILVDIVCHGVPSPYIWRDYIAYLERKNNDTIVSLNFRDKARYGWNMHKETFIFSKDSESKTFKYLFYKSLYFRKSCYSCHFANTRRPSDITLADYWGVEKNLPNINADNKGCNLILANTCKGFKLFEAIKEKLNFSEVRLKSSLQPNLQHPSDMPVQRDQFEKDYTRKGFEYVYFKYGEEGLRYKINVVKERLKNKLRQKLGIK